MDNKNLPQVPTKFENEAELDTIRKKFNVDENRFWKGVQFVTLILDGHAKTKSYMAVTGCDNTTARKNAGSLHRAKWIQEVQRFMTPDDNTLYIGEIKDIIAANMEIIRDRASSPREIAECTKALQPYIKIAKLELDVTEEIKISAGESITTQLNQQLKQLSNSGKMINEDGDIIDVEPIQ